MRRGKVLIAGALLLCSQTHSQPLSELLRKYEEASALVNRTRKESLGHVVVFTREDLERMQARRLSDVLKSLRFFTVANNRFGVLSLFHYGEYIPMPREIRLYINDHEVSSLHTGSPFLVWENFPLDVVEHIEVYYGMGAIELGNEPAFLIVKVYTKEPRRENARTLRSSINSRGGYEGVFYSAYEVSSDFSYIFLLTDGLDNRKDYRLSGEKLSRDALYRYAYLGLYSKKVNLEIGYGFVRRNPFMGFAVDGVAEEGRTRAEDLYVVLTARPTAGMKVVLSFDNHRRKHYERSESGLYIPVFADPDPLKNPKDFYENAFFNKVDLYVSKEFRSKRNKLLTALSYKLYNSDIDARRYTRINGEEVNVGETVPFNRQEIYSLIFEDQLSVSEGNLLVGGIKVDKYFRNGGFKDFEEFIGRVGLISVPRDWLTLKGFISRSYIPPYFYDTDVSGRDLDTVKLPVSVTLEASVSLDALSLSIGGGYTEAKDLIVPDSRGLLMNAGGTYRFRPLFVSIDYRFSESGKLTAGYSTFLDPESRNLPTSGGFLRYTTSLRRFDAFAELVYRSGFNFRGRHVREGYDLSAGMAYRITENLSVRLKGENLLGRATEVPYVLYATGEVLTLPVRERVLSASVDWVF